MYVVFGKATTDRVDLSSAAFLTGGGIRIDGAAAYDQLGNAMASVGKLDADTKDDIVVTAKYTDTHSRTDAGSAYVVFGTATSGVVNLANLGAGGYEIDGAQTGDTTGSKVVGAGDVNGDGIPDILLGARAAGRNGRNNSASRTSSSARRRRPATRRPSRSTSTGSWTPPAGRAPL